MTYEERKANRFQFQPWYVKLWRYRWYIPIPYWAVCAWLNRPIDEEFPMSFSNIWGMYVGLAQVEMGWWYTTKEVKESLDDKRTSR